MQAPFRISLAMVRATGRNNSMGNNDLSRDTTPTVLEMLERIPPEELEQTIADLLECRSPEEICSALRVLIATAPRAEFDQLRDLLRKHCPQH